jgi:hypothetical protein
MRYVMTASECHSRIFRDRLRRAFGRWLNVDRSVRERRVLLLLAGVWLLSAFDLGFTLVARSLGMLVELNPIAAWLMGGHGNLAVIVYKVVLMTIGTVILWRFREKQRAESAAWLMLMVHVALSMRWYAYYHNEVPPDPFVDVLGPTASFRASAARRRGAPVLHDRTRTDDARSGSGGVARR